MPAQQPLRSRGACDWRDLILKNIESLDYGSVEIVIHDSRVVHIDTTKRFRLERDRPNLRAAIARADQPVQAVRCLPRA